MKRFSIEMLFFQLVLSLFLQNSRFRDDKNDSCFYETFIYFYLNVIVSFKVTKYSAIILRFSKRTTMNSENHYFRCRILCPFFSRFLSFSDF